MKQLLQVFFAMCIFATGLSAQVAAEDYSQKKFKEILRAHKECADAKSAINVCADLHKYKVRVRYLGQIRLIPSDRSGFFENLIKAWGKEEAISQVLATYHQEILVEQAGIKIWVPIQDVLVPEVQQYVKPDHLMDAYLVIPGSIKAELIFIMTRFDEVE